ncbi:unnamed protein product [Nezara viridula]|uniref:Uncharacterized protein n=1 Tax=Nezara viridula TaxID=85310 RepID=A0A9P0HDW6_NEZVI|nr:unnamed protein product [Nezara viridula]
MGIHHAASAAALWNINAEFYITAYSALCSGSFKFFSTEANDSRNREFTMVSIWISGVGDGSSKFDRVLEKYSTKDSAIVSGRILFLDGGDDPSRFLVHQILYLFDLCPYSIAIPTA